MITICHTNGLKDVVEETQLLLKENSKWKELYAGYAKGIRSNRFLFRSIRSTFREWSPLKLYLTTTNAKSAKNSVTFELRYMGQTTAILKAHKNNQHIISTKGYDVTNQRDFECNIELENDDWHGEKARNFAVSLNCGAVHEKQEAENEMMSTALRAFY